MPNVRATTTHAPRAARLFRATLAAGLVILLLAPSVQACFSSNSKHGYNHVDDREIVLYPEAETETTGQFLSTDKAAGKVDLFKPSQTGPASGPTQYVYTPTGRKVPATEFHLSGGAPADLWLNLSKTITGDMHFSSTVALGQVRMEILTKDETGKEVLVGGDGYNLGTSRQWYFFVMIKPEVHLIKKGAPLWIRVYHLQGPADLQFGTGGTQQSYLEIHYCDRDPLLTGSYLNGSTRKFIVPPCITGAAAPEPSGTPGGPAVKGEGLAIVALPSLLIGLAGLTVRRTRPLLAVALLLAVGFAGCLGGDADGRSQGTGPGATEPTGAVDIRYEADPPDAPGNKTLGSMVGTVTQMGKGIPIGGAHVAVLGTSLFTNTNNQGQFRFLDMVPGEYTLQIDAKGFKSVNPKVLIQPAQQAVLTVEMASLVAKASGQEAHIHDDWAGATQIELYNGPILATGALPEGKLVLPGTKLVRVTLQWTPAPNGPFEVELAVSMATSGTFCYAHRGPGIPYNVALFPHEADPGHASVSRWLFDVNSALPAGASMKIEIFKGVVPYESEHLDPWRGKTVLPVWNGATRQGGASGTRSGFTYFDDYPHNSLYWVPVLYEIGGKPAEKWVIPPGSKTIKGTLTYANPDYQTANLPQTVWNVVFKSADMKYDSSAKANQYPWRQAQMTANGTNKRDFTIDVKADWTDKFYDQYSTWRFTVDDGKPPIAGTDGSALGAKSDNSGYGTTFTLTAWVYRDPSWKDE